MRDPLGVFVVFSLTGVKVGKDPCSELIWASLMMILRNGTSPRLRSFLFGLAVVVGQIINSDGVAPAKV